MKKPKEKTAVLRVKHSVHTALKNFCDATGTIMVAFASRAIEGELKRRSNEKA